MPESIVIAVPINRARKSAGMMSRDSLTYAPLVF